MTVLDDEQPTEATPLILGRSSHPLASGRSLPPLAPAVNRIRHHGLQTADEDPAFFFSSSASLAEQVSFKMIVFLQLYLLTRTPAASEGKDVWEQWSKERASSLDAEDLERRVVHVWEEFLEVSRSTQEIEDCLWSSFPLEEGKSATVRVIDILKDPDVPPALISHRLVILSLLRTWTHGKAVIPAGSLSRRLVQKFDSVATPRVVHAVDVFLQLGYLALLSNYILNPPERPIITNRIPNFIGARESLLMIYTTASLLRPPSFLIGPYVLVACAFYLSLPSAPFPGDTSYSILLGALLLHVLALHLPRTPSPNFLVSPEVTLPLSTLLWYEFSRTLYPVVLFYLPATLLASFFLSVALADSIPHMTTATFAFMSPAPMEIRQAFFALWSALLLLILASTVLLVLFSASLLSASSRPASPWDRYSVAVGLRSRRIFAKAVAAYTNPYYFPPPFNLLHILFVHAPRLLVRLSGQKESVFLGHIEGVLWRLTTGILAFVVAGCWLWTASLPLTPFLGQ
ncbi:hypothetical protein BC834DRAFT_965186 [Gloeopeniophorella convolvens]|nr:hypothetical protein BC834DRAFT_965186 [Gloeopeniophorella convolvens]